MENIRDSSVRESRDVSQDGVTAVVCPTWRASRTMRQVHFPLQSLWKQGQEGKWSCHMSSTHCMRVTGDKIHLSHPSTDSCYYARCCSYSPAFKRLIFFIFSAERNALEGVCTLGSKFWRDSELWLEFLFQRQWTKCLCGDINGDGEGKKSKKLLYKFCVASEGFLFFFVLVMALCSLSQ